MKHLEYLWIIVPIAITEMVLWYFRLKWFFRDDGA